MRTVLALFLMALIIVSGFQVAVVLLERTDMLIKARSQWPTAQGTVTSSRENYADDLESDPNAPAYHVTVEFTYEVDGMQYSGRQDWLGLGSGEAHKYSPGTLITVHYDPEKREMAVIEPEKESFWSLPLMFWLPVICTCICCTLVWTLVMHHIPMIPAVIAGVVVIIMGIYYLSLFLRVPFPLVVLVPAGIGLTARVLQTGWRLLLKRKEVKRE